MNRAQKAAAVAEIAEQLKEADAVFAIDYRGISVPQAAQLRVRLREADATFRVVKNTLTERAAEEAGTESLKALLQGPTALTFVRGDAALAAKTISTLARETETLAFKGGILDGETLDPEQITAISRLPARDVLYGQLVGLVASPAEAEATEAEAPAEPEAAAPEAEEAPAEPEAAAPEPEAPSAEAAAPDADASADDTTSEND